MNFLQRWIVKLAVKRGLAAAHKSLQEASMEGWKTKLGGIGGILSGLAIIAAAFTAQTFDYQTIITGLLAISGGFAAIGLGHKADKVKAVLEKLAQK